MSIRDQEILIRSQRVDNWNRWRRENPGIKIDLSGADLAGLRLSHIDLSYADLRGTNLGSTDLSYANLTEADLTQANMFEVNLLVANLSGAQLVSTHLHMGFLRNTILRKVSIVGADMVSVDLSNADLRGAIIRKTNLRWANLNEANLREATIQSCSIYGISVWGTNLEETKQSDLIITPEHGNSITVEYVETAQLIYLLMNNQNFHSVLQSINTKLVLILGRFTKERKRVLDLLRTRLRTYGYLSVMFDFPRLKNQDLTQTMSTLANLAHFIIVDLTDPSSAPHEVASIVPTYVVPYKPILLQSIIINGSTVENQEYSMFEDLRRRYHWTLPTFCYLDDDHLLSSLKAEIIDQAEQKSQELEESIKRSKKAKR